MGCDKRYGLREVWVAPEASPNSPATYTQDNYLQHCTGSNFPALYRENLENGEATGNRGQSQAFDGAQAELAWDVTVIMPDNSTIGTPASLPESLQSLFWAAGFGSDSGPSAWTPTHGAYTMDIQANSACGRTIQLIGLDRDKRQLELLTGAVVSQITLTYSRSDICTIQFSGTAAQKYEATAPRIPTSMLGNTDFSTEARSSFGLALPTSPAILTGVSLTLPGASSELASITSSSITLKADLSSSTITARTQSYWSIAKPSTTYDVLSPDSWSVDGFGSVQSATLTMETGQAYGELTTEAQYPTELLSGQVKVTASVTAYLIDANIGTMLYDSGNPLYIYHSPGLSGHAWTMQSAKFTERPAIDLSSVDTPASGDFSLQGGETQNQITNNALDVLYLS